MEPKYLSFRRWRWHPLLIIWRSVIGSLGLDIHHSERIDGDRHSQKVVKSFRGHDTRIYTNTWELRHRSSPGGILHCPLNMHGWIYIYILKYIYLYVYVTMHLVLHLTICVQETSSESSWTLTSDKPSKVHMLLARFCKLSMSWPADVSYDRGFWNTTNQLGYASKEGTEEWRVWPVFGQFVLWVHKRELVIIWRLTTINCFFFHIKVWKWTARLQSV